MNILEILENSGLLRRTSLSISFHFPSFLAKSRKEGKKSVHTHTHTALFSVELRPNMRRLYAPARMEAPQETDRNKGYEPAGANQSTHGPAGAPEENTAREKKRRVVDINDIYIY